MIHHDCRHTANDFDGVLSTITDTKPTVAGVGYDGRYRCTECKRRVEMDPVDGETWRSDLIHAPRVEPPYPEGWC